MSTKISQWAAIIVTVVGTLGASTWAQGWISHNTVAFGLLVALAQVLHALFPSLFPAAPESSTKEKP